MKISLTFSNYNEFEEYRALHLRTFNTLEPYKWPAWAHDMNAAIEMVRQRPVSLVLGEAVFGCVQLGMVQPPAQVRCENIVVLNTPDKGIHIS